VPQKLLEHVRGAITHLRPDAVRELAERPLRIVIRTPKPEAAAGLQSFLLGESLGAGRRKDAAAALVYEADAVAGMRFQLALHEAGLPAPEGWEEGRDAFVFLPAEPGLTVDAILDAREDLSLALACRFAPFRDRVTRRIIHKVAAENAMFAVMSALPDLVSSLAEIPWAVGEFASDTAVLTVNQIRMAFELAAASDHGVGFREQRSEIGSLVAGAFGWRTLAREAASKIPFGGGLIPKAAIAYAGTWVAGVSLERLYGFGYGLTRAERSAAWSEAFQRGKDVAAQLMARARRPQPAVETPAPAVEPEEGA
jgi:hypothetical protein